MSTAIKKPPPPGTTGRSSANPPSGVNSRSPSRSATPTTSTPNGVKRTTSTRGGATTSTPMSARASVRKPAASSLSKDTSPSRDAIAAKKEEEDKAKAEETAALINDLKEQLQKAEATSEDYQKQIEVLKTRLEDALQEQAKLEERMHEAEEHVEELQNEKRESARQRRELDAIYEAERASAMKEKEQAQVREDELHEVIQRLKDNIAEREREGEDEETHMPRRNSRIAHPLNSRTNSVGNLEFAPPSSLQRSNSSNSSKLLLQKDKLIESLRLELAESQIKAIELENMGDGRLQELERVLLETRMTNARLMEDNESFQLLLSERTLNGDFSRGEFMRSTNARGDEPTGNSLADELGAAAEDDLDHRRLEAEITALKDQNKALSLYINKIIERLLQHQGFEAVLNQDEDLPTKPTAAKSPQFNNNKDLPPPPPPKEDPKPSFLQRAKSVALGNSGQGPRPRPLSVMPAPRESLEYSVMNDPNAAPSIPLGRAASMRHASGHRRANSEWSNSASVVVNNMYRGGPRSPSIVSPRASFFGGLPVNPNQSGSGSTVGSRVASGASSMAPRQSTEEAGSSMPAGANPNRFSNSKLDELSNSDSGIAVDAPSPPRSVASSFDRPSNVLAGNKPRPLRLVQESEEAERERKAANRQSWIAGWFSGNKAQE